MAKGDKLKGALSREPRNRGTRVSPGVYRSPKGNLVKPRQQYMERRRQQQPNQPAPSGPPASLMGRIEAEGPTQQDFTGAVTNAMQYNPGQMGNAWGPNQSGRPMARRGDGRDRADMIGQQEFINAVNSFRGNEHRPAQPSDIQDGLGRPMGANIDPGWQIQRPIMSFENQFQPSANQGGRYRLSPGVYGTREQAERQYERETQRQPYEMYAKPYWKMS